MPKKTKIVFSNDGKNLPETNVILLLTHKNAVHNRRYVCSIITYPSRCLFGYSKLETSTSISS